MLAMLLDNHLQGIYLLNIYVHQTGIVQKIIGKEILNVVCGQISFPITRTINMCLKDVENYQLVEATDLKTASLFQCWLLHVTKSCQRNITGYLKFV